MHVCQSGDMKNPLNKWYSLWDVSLLIGSGGGADMFLAVRALHVTIAMRVSEEAVMHLC